MYKKYTNFEANDRTVTDIPRQRTTCVKFQIYALFKEKKIFKCKAFFELNLLGGRSKGRTVCTMLAQLHGRITKLANLIVRPRNLQLTLRPVGN